MDCEGGPAAGHGRITVDGITVRFRLTETRVAAVSLLQVTGAGFSGVGQAHACASASPAEPAAACNGSGLRHSPVDITVHG